ncbi:pentapeptide repeat-containing protein [Pacificibacter marinus]|nr:pentapeptide repeat-containing protein [Pacificibacter marinus]
MTKFISVNHQTMANDEHVSIFRKGPDAVKKYMAAKGLRSLDLSDQIFDGLNFPSGYVLVGTKFENSRFQDCDISLHVPNANLRNCVLRGRKLKIRMVGNAILEGAELYDLDLTITDGLSQQQIDSTKVGVNVQLNEYLRPAEHWEPTEGKEGKTQGGNPPPSITPHRPNPNSNKYPDLWPDVPMSPPGPSGQIRDLEVSSGAQVFPTTSELAKRIEVNNLSVRLTGVSLVDAIDGFLLKIEQSNSLETEFKEQAKTFLTQHMANLETLLLALPEPGESVSEDTVESTKPALETYLSTAKDGFRVLLDPKRLGEMTVPTGVVLLSAALGAQFGAPLAGIAFGAWFSGRESTEKLARKFLSDPKD